MENSNQKVVLITGASSGIGQAIAQKLTRQGLQVFGTSRNPSTQENQKGFEVLALDVHSDKSAREFIRTNLAHNGQTPATSISDYEYTREKTFEAVQKLISKAPKATLVAETVERIIKTKSPKLRYQVGKDANLVAALRRFVPESVFEKVWRKNFNLDSIKQNLHAAAVINQ